MKTEEGDWQCWKWSWALVSESSMTVIRDLDVK